MTRRLERGRHAGVLVPLFSIPSTRSWGIGEIGDLASFGEWLRSAGQDLLQLLPIHEMAPGQHSPYTCLSAMAIDPIYIGLGELEDFDAVGGEAALDEASRALLARARGAPAVDWPAVRELKGAALRAAFARFWEVEWSRAGGRARALRAYAEAERWWLPDYALFRALHARHGGRAWTSWPAALRAREAAALRRARESLAREILFYQYLQWVADGQWRRALERLAPVAVLGDLPFMVGWDSADVWGHQELFDLDASVGTPPDAFNEVGQDWGLPAYRWEVFRRRGYPWLTERARRCRALYHAYRVDHVVGFYRTYVRPRDGRAHYWSPAAEAEQLRLGEEILRLFAADGMPIVAEDLGTVPDFVRASLARLGVPGYRVLRWEREWDVAGRPFRDPAAWPAASVATSGTHDTATLADWWDGLPLEDRARLCRIPALRALAKETPGRGYDDRVRDALLRALFGAGSDLLVLPIQDVFGWRDRINVPGSVGEANWTYRLPWPSDRLEAESEAAARARALREWTRQSGRAGGAR